jgi:hypothetical protein
MSNEIDLVVGSVAFKQITDLLVELGKVDGEIKKIGESAIKMNTALGVKNTADLTKLSAENAKLNKEIEKLIGSAAVLETKLANATAAQAKSTKATTDALIAEEKLIAAKQRNTDATQKNADKETKASQTRSKYITQETIDVRLKNKELAQTYTELSKNAGAYDKHDAQYRKMAKSLKDMAFEGKEGTKDFIEKEKALTTLGNRLKSVDAITGSHTRNVGNYASSWNGLGNSINQLTREAPAFANSLQTGFMALSNNIPILTDELGILIDKNKKLKADGKPTESMLKTVAGAFFSWQTAISLGVTILTVYGAKIWEMITAGDKAAESQKKLNDELSNVKNTVTTQMTQLSSLVDIVNSSTESEKNRQLAYDEIKKTLPGLTSATYNQAIATGELKNATDLYVLSLIQQQLVETQVKSISDEQTKLNEKKSLSYKEYIGKVESWLQSLQPEKIQKNLEKSLTTQRKLEEGNQQDIIDNRRKGLVKLQEDFLKTQKALKTFVTPPKEEETGEDKSAEDAAKAEEENAKNKYNREISDLNRSKELIQDKYDAEEEGTRMRISLSNELALSQINIIEAQYNEEVRLAKNNADLIKIADNNLATARENILKENGKRIIAEQEKIHKKIGELANEEKYGVDTYFMPIEDVKTWVDEWNRIQKDKADKDKQNAADKKKSDEEQANYLQSFVSEFASKSGLSETFNMLSGQIDGFGDKAGVTFNAIAESAQEMFNMINESSQASFDAEYARLDAQKNEAIKNAGDSTVAKEKIEADYAAKKKEIQLREFKQKQKMSMVNIAIDTAQAIVATFAQTPPPAGIPLAIMMGVMGAIQLGVVASQKPPAYADGTDNHSGGLMLVNDGAGANFQEKVILPSGKVIRPQGRNVLMDAPKGTKVLNHEQQLFEMLQSNNISMSSPQYQGMTPDEMDEILGKHFGNIKTQNTIFDKNGFQTYVRNGNSITRSNSNRSQAIGISV